MPQRCSQRRTSRTVASAEGSGLLLLALAEGKMKGYRRPVACGRRSPPIGRTGSAGATRITPGSAKVCLIVRPIRVPGLLRRSPARLRRKPDGRPARRKPPVAVTRRRLQEQRICASPVLQETSVRLPCSGSEMAGTAAAVRFSPFNGSHSTLAAGLYREPRHWGRRNEHRKACCHGPTSEYSTVRQPVFTCLDRGVRL